MNVEYYLFLAEAFGFGPVSSSITVARQIKAHSNKKVIFIGCGTSYQLARLSNVFDEVHFNKELSSSYLTTFNNEVTIENCLVIANTYPDGIIAAKEALFKCVFIDTLFWMWKNLPIILNDVERYYIEDFLCVDLQPTRFGKSNKFKVVPALINLDIDSHRINHPFLLVSLGGIDSNLYDFPVFYEKLIEYISCEDKFKGYFVMVCGGGEKFRRNHFKKFEHTRLTITCLGPEEYISYLKSADMVISSAGLHGFYENYFLNKNVLFLPPQSYSQYLQLKYIQTYFPDVVTVNFEQLEIKHTLRENMPDEERIREVKKTNLELVEDQSWRVFRCTFEMFLSGTISSSWPEKIGSQEENNGPITLAKDILSLYQRT